jgi:hypothetical protein
MLFVGESTMLEIIKNIKQDAKIQIGVLCFGEKDNNKKYFFFEKIYFNYLSYQTNS